MVDYVCKDNEKNTSLQRKIKKAPFGAFFYWLVYILYKAESGSALNFFNALSRI